MSKLGIPDYATVAASNTDIDGVDCTGNTGLIRNGDNYVRSLMAHLATFYDELGGTGTVGGTANAITLTTSATAPFGSLANGNIVAFKNTVGPNTAATTINVDALGAKAIRLQGDTALAGGELALNGVYLLRYDTAYNSAAGAWIVLNPENNGNIAREKLLAARTYYVRTDGSNSNDGLSNTSGGAFLTVQHAVDAIATLDCGIYSATVQIASGTYTTPVVLKQILGSGTYKITGDTSTPTNVIISTTGADAIAATGIQTPWYVEGFRVTTAAGGNSIAAYSGARIFFQSVDFFTCSATFWAQIWSVNGSLVQAYGNYSISGTAASHWHADGNSNISVVGFTVTISNTPAFSGAFAQSYGASNLAVNGNTFTGTGTGTRYSAALNGVINVNGGGASYLPGNSAGSTSTGGQYA